MRQIGPVGWPGPNLAEYDHQDIFLRGVPVIIVSMFPSDHNKRIPMPKPLIEVALDSGRRIAAVQLHVGFTYGTYTKVFSHGERMNEINLELLWGEYPARVLWEREFPSILLRRNEYQEKGTTSLPVYKVTALFESEALKPGTGRHSAMVISWFQDKMKPLLSPGNRRAMKQLDWENLAKDFQ